MHQFDFKGLTSMHDYVTNHNQYRPDLDKLLKAINAEYCMSIGYNELLLYRILNNRRTHNIIIRKTLLQHNSILLEQHKSTKNCLLKFNCFADIVDCLSSLPVFDKYEIDA
jgi:hypothetical protein